MNHKMDCAKCRFFEVISGPKIYYDEYERETVVQDVTYFTCHNSGMSIDMSGDVATCSGFASKEDEE